MSISAAEFLKWLEVFNISQNSGGGPAIYTVQAITTQSYSMSYNNGMGGVGATLTSLLAGPIAIDQVYAVPGSAYAINNQTDQSQNGIYICTQQGTLPTGHAVFTRATYYDQPGDIKVGDLVNVLGGNTQNGSTWAQTQAVTAVGPGNNIIFQETGASFITLTGDVTGAGTGSIATTLATVNTSPGTYGNAASTLVYTVDAKGRLTATTTTAIQIAESQVTNLISDLANKLNLSGGTMTGALTLAADPTGALQAATKEYVDAGDIIASWNGSTMTGVNISAGAGISLSSSGVINATGSGSPTPCAFIANLSTALLNATGDGTLVSVTCDNVTTNIGSSYSGSTGLFTAPFNGIYAFVTDVFLGNLSTSHTQYLMYALVNGTTLYMMSQGNPANERSTASSQLTRRGAVILQLTAGQTVQMQVEIDGTSKTATIGSGAQPTSFAGYLIGTTIGSPGVVSLNTLTGILSLISSNSTLSFTSGSSTIDCSVTLPAGFYTPSISILQGATGVTVQNASYNATSPNSGGRVNCNAIIDVNVDASGDIVQLLLSGPITENFTASNQSSPLGFGIVALSGLGMPGQIGCGWFQQLYAYTAGPNASFLAFETANPSTTYRINIAWSYFIQ